jgi:hypothetical protein
MATVQNVPQPDGADLAAPRGGPSEVAPRRGGSRVKLNESPAGSGSESASPFPPPLRWDAAQSEAPTQVMGAIVDLFQPVGMNPGKTTGEPVNNPSGSSAPPWVDSDLPTIAEQQRAWLRQRPGVVEASAMPPRSKQIIGIAVLAVVVLGLIGATVAYFLTTGPDRTDSEQIAAPQPTAVPRDLPAPPAPLPAPVDTEHALIDPPGRARGGGGLFDLPQLKSTNLLPRPIQDALQAGGMTDGVLKTTATTDGTTIGIFALTMPDQQTATTVAQEIATAQLRGGLKADDNRALQGVAVMGSVPGSESTVYRAVYVLYNRAIFLEVFGSHRDDVLGTFDSMVSQQVHHAPPTVRAGH